MQGLPVVIDADGISVVISDLDTVRGYHRAVLTPNTPEFWRLASAVGVEHNHTSPHSSARLVQVMRPSMRATWQR
jgi:ATP-dependent NAD(P)H-hydrate dehydratase